MPYRKGRWVKLVHELKRADAVLEPVGSVGIASGYRNGLLEVHFVTFPKGETRAIALVPESWVALVMSKAELPADRALHLPENWTPEV